MITVWENETTPGSAPTLTRGLTHTLSEQGGAAVQPTDFPIEWPEAFRVRAARNVVQDGDCWLWEGGTRVKGGYRQIRFGGRSKMVAHRAAFTMSVRSPSPDEQVDHLCRRTNCVNPRHLEAVTGDENIRRRDHARREREEGVRAEMDAWRLRALRAEAALAELTAPNPRNGVPMHYSADPSHYMPLCKSDHVRFDQTRKAAS